MSIDAEQRLFSLCLDATSTAAREQLLVDYPDNAVAMRVRHLLSLHDNDSLSEAFAPADFPRLAAPHRVGEYLVRQRLGEGAMGEVYLAEQQEPMRRQVALKILKFGLGTREVIARFELERQMLAMLTHPNIARIFDAGATEDGRPYFVMEYVAGVSLAHYCDQNQLGIEARLELFGQVCAGVQHAHLRGVIHRDLKPSNILVAIVDGQAIPKIIDFGIAKATGGGGDGEEAFTRVGHLLGTPEYMSPEQAQLSPLDIDVRTDVYSLGMVLYELLTGVRPYAVSRDSFDPAVLAREILDSEPQRPSQRVLDLSQESEERAQHRNLSPRSLSARLRGDFDWIVLKALEKDRQRRYLSAADLAADLIRAQRHEPVLAGPPGARYRVGKFVRRHRFGVSLVVGLFFAALAFGSGMAVLARQAARERDRASAEAETARRVTSFTAGLFELADPAATGSSNVSARELLDAGTRRLQAEIGSEHTEVQAALLEAAGNAYRGLGDYDRAGPLLSRAVRLRQDGDVAAYAQALQSDATLARMQGDFGRAEARAREAVTAADAAGSAPVTVRLRSQLELAEVLRLRSKLDEAAAEARAARDGFIVLQPPDPGGLAAANLLLGRIHAAQGLLPEAEVELVSALEMHRRLYGDASHATLKAKDAVADVLVMRDQSARAEPLLREIVTDTRHIYGETHPEVAVALNNLANALADFPEKFSEAEQIYGESIALLRATAGPQHPELAMTLNNLGSLYLKLHRWEDAHVAYAESIGIREKILGASHPETAAAQLGEALALNKLGKFAPAEQLLRAAVSSFTLNIGADHWRTANAEMYLGMVLGNLGRYSDADAYLVAAERKLAAALGPHHARTLAAAKARADLAVQRVARVSARVPAPSP